MAAIVLPLPYRGSTLYPFPPLFRLIQVAVPNHILDNSLIESVHIPTSCMPIHPAQCCYSAHPDVQQVAYARPIKLRGSKWPPKSIDPSVALRYSTKTRATCGSAAIAWSGDTETAIQEALTHLMLLNNRDVTTQLVFQRQRGLRTERGRGVLVDVGFFFLQKRGSTRGVDEIFPRA
jgi:hypothetical protein